MESDQEFLANALLQWEESLKCNQEKSANELCHAKPHLVDELQRQIHALKKTSFLENIDQENEVEADLPILSSGYENQLVSRRYRLQKKLAEGGFAEVWLGYDEELHRQVAIKLPKPNHIGSLDFFVSEARRVARLNHPNIVPVHDIVKENSLVYIVSEFMPGGSLKEKITSESVSPQQAREWVLQIADALQHAHAAQIIHRDLKPANILLDQQGKAKIGDFGIALSPNKTGEFAPSMGTLPYMSPEHLDGKCLDARSDIYSVGVLYHELLQGKIPYPTSGLNTLRNNISVGNVEYASESGKLPKKVREILSKCLAKNPDNRFASAKELAEALRPEVAGRRSLLMLVLLAVLLLVMAMVIMAVLLFMKKNTDLIGSGGVLFSNPNLLAESLSQGRQSFNRKDFQQAHKYFTEAIHSDPACVEAYHKRAAAIFNMGKYRDSLPDFDKAVELAPNNAEIRRNRSLPLMHLRQFDKAMADLESAIQAEPATKIQSMKLLGSIHYAKAYDLEEALKLNDALVESNLAIECDPSPKNYQQRGIIHFKLMEYEKSVDDLTKAVAQAPNVAWHYEKRALALEALGRKNEADADFLKAKEIKNKNVQKANDNSALPDNIKGSKSDFNFWLNSVKNLEPAQKKTEFIQKMKELNPDFDGNVGFSFAGRELRVLEFRSSKVSDINPVKMFPELKHLHCWALPEQRSPLSDFSPLVGMKLHSLNASNTNLEDISFLAEMPIDDLHISSTRVSDLGPLQGKKITRIFINGSRVKDISPVLNTALREIDMGLNQIKNPEMLKTLKNLEKVSGMSVDKWMKKHFEND